MEDCRSSPVVRALLEATPDGILVTDASGRIVVTNERFREVVGGVGPTPTVGEPIVEWLRRLGTPLANEWSGIESRTLAGDPVHEMGFSLDLPEDSTRVLTVSTALVDRPDGEPCVLSVWQDLTAHTRAKEDLARSERFNRSMVESSPLGIIVLDGEGRLTYENPAVRRLLGVPEGMESPALGMRLQPEPRDQSLGGHHRLTSSVVKQIISRS